MNEAATAIPIIRAHDRLLTLVFVAWSQGGRSGSWSTHDLSVGGMSVKGSVPNPKGPVFMRLRVGTESVHVRARQQWTRRANDGTDLSGLRFERLKAEQAAALEILMETLHGLSQQALPEPDEWPLQYADDDNSLDAATSGLMWLIGAAAVSAFAAAGVIYLLP
ncbi:MAG: PilZ domain-containing protein [Proteobacteria bacterium]|nr:PilZ domain-containing protein [Pseudomonadota bacterium]MCP4916827.1 PilZ domain-containing protein [Pseudomonadota bacterium]